jgi:hypothetical protein
MDPAALGGEPGQARRIGRIWWAPTDGGRRPGIAASLAAPARRDFPTPAFRQAQRSAAGDTVPSRLYPPPSGARPATSRRWWYQLSRLWRSSFMPGNQGDQKLPDLFEVVCQTVFLSSCLKHCQRCTLPTRSLPLPITVYHFVGTGPVLLSRSSFNSGPRTTDLSHQFPSELSTSPPLGVNAAHQMVRLMPGDSVRTLPSAKPTRMPPA